MICVTYLSDVFAESARASIEGRRVDPSWRGFDSKRFNEPINRFKYNIGALAIVLGLAESRLGSHNPYLETNISRAWRYPRSGQRVNIGIAVASLIWCCCIVHKT